jgi:hypothetical protein
MKTWALMYLLIWLVFLEMLIAFFPVLAFQPNEYLHGVVGVAVAALAVGVFREIRKSECPDRIKLIVKTTASFTIADGLLGVVLFLPSQWSLTGSVLDFVRFLHFALAVAIITQASASALAFDMWEEKEFAPPSSAPSGVLASRAAGVDGAASDSRFPVQASGPTPTPSSAVPRSETRAPPGPSAQLPPGAIEIVTKQINGKPVQVVRIRRSQARKQASAMKRLLIAAVPGFFGLMGLSQVYQGRKATGFAFFLAGAIASFLSSWYIIILSRIDAALTHGAILPAYALSLISSLNVSSPLASKLSVDMLGVVAVLWAVQLFDAMGPFERNLRKRRSPSETA